MDSALQKADKHFTLLVFANTVAAYRSPSILIEGPRLERGLEADTMCNQGKIDIVVL